MNDTHQIFISYPDWNSDIVENLQGRLKEFGVTTWVYSRDKTLLKNAWDEIESKIKNCQVFLYVFSKHTDGAAGQQRELDFVISQLSNRQIDIKIFPIIVGEINFSNLPKEIKYTNGLELSAFNVKTCAYQISTLFFPELFSEFNSLQWKYPKPGQWLQICKMDPQIEEYFELGDYLYFRRISPLGLFECYAPKIEGMFWIYPPNVCISNIIDEDGSYERLNVPDKYRISSIYMAEYQYLNKKT